MALCHWVASTKAVETGPAKGPTSMAFQPTIEDTREALPLSPSAAHRPVLASRRQMAR
jgi:hypothetical protein